MKLFLMGGVVGFVVGVAITAMYFSLATLFAANAKFSATQAKRQSTVPTDSEILIPIESTAADRSVRATPSCINDKARGVGA